MFTRHSTRRGSRFALLAGALALVASFALTGCYESSTDPGDDTATTAVLDDLTIGEITEKVQITDEQAQALAPVLERYRQNRSNREMRRLGTMQMLAEASDVLDAEQMQQLVDLLVEKRQERRREHRQQRMEQRQQQNPGGLNGGPGRGPGPRGGMGPHRGKGPGDGSGPGGGLLSQLELSAEQQEALAALREEHHAARQALVTQFRNGEITEEQFRAAGQELREQHRAAVAALLTAEQNAQLAQLRAERVLQHLERSLERLQERAEQHLALMTRILDLTDEQVAAAQALHEDAVTTLSGIVESLRGGALSADEARQAAQDLREQSRTAFRDLLTPEQQTLFDALEQLRGGHRFGRGR